ncbi:hypothetical protein HK098_006998 [Nowakowskiella sp. JEL0407]|nr:hypothetical protein HK098_006998 [Nowakowskiella sp. JEL0407]
MFPYVIYGLYTLMNILSLVSDPARSFSERALKIGSVWVIYVILSLVVSATPFWLCLWYINVKSKEVKVWQPAQKTGLVIASDLGKGGSSGGGENVVEIYSPLIDQSQDQNGESSGVQYIYGNAGSSPTQAKQLPPVPVTFTA